MKAILLSVTLTFVAAAQVSATEALTFYGGGYAIYILVGEADKPTVGQVRFSQPGDKPAVIVPRELLRIEKFDEQKHTLIMRFTNKKEPDLPAAFSLVVRKESAVLTIGSDQVAAHLIGSISAT